MPRGGKRAGAGRPKTNHAVPKAFAERVLGRIGELKIRGIKNAEDYVLQLLKSKDERIRKEVFVNLTDRAFGKAPQADKPELIETGTDGFKVTVEYIGRAHPPATEAS
jgi:hypothetical protein